MHRTPLMLKLCKDLLMSFDHLRLLSISMSSVSIQRREGGQLLATARVIESEIRERRQPGSNTQRGDLHISHFREGRSTKNLSSS
jgi:hypothetical protein